jgi:hypothetical protein
VEKQETGNLLYVQTLSLSKIPAAGQRIISKEIQLQVRWTLTLSRVGANGPVFCLRGDKIFFRRVIGEIPWSPAVLNYLVFKIKHLISFEPLNETEEYKAIEMSDSFVLIVAIVRRKRDYAIVPLQSSGAKSFT